MVKKRQNKNWAKTAVKQPGAFKSWCLKRGHKGADTSCIKSGMKASKPVTVRRRANLANNFKKMRARRKAK
jgi:hypothetical protein